MTEGVDLACISFPRVNSLQYAKLLTNVYSVPLKLKPVTQVRAKAYASFVELWYEGRCIARYERCYRHLQQVLDLEHTLMS
jgi:hypothetical protein